MKMKNLRIIIVMCILITILSACGKNDSVAHDETKSPEISSETIHEYTPVFSGWGQWAGGPEKLFKVSKLVDENGNAVTGEMCNIEKYTDSYGKPMWFCKYYGRHGYTTAELIAEDGSWSHTLKGYGIRCLIDENGQLCIGGVLYNSTLSVDDTAEIDIDSDKTFIYKVGKDIVLTGSELSEKTAEDNHSGVWDSNSKTLSYNGISVKLPDNISYADYENKVLVDTFNGDERTIYWDGNIFAESEEAVQFLFDASGERVILEGKYLDRVEDKVNHKIYYTAIGSDDQLRVYNQQGEYIAELEGRFVAECWDGVFWTVSVDESKIVSFETKEYEIYSVSVDE